MKIIHKTIFLIMLFLALPLVAFAATDGVIVTQTVTEATATQTPTEGGGGILFPLEDDEEIIPDVIGPGGVVDTTAPLNVSNLHAVAFKDSIKLTWDNPQDEDFAGVRIVRNTQFYPLSLDNGETVYIGSTSRFEDTDVLLDQMYYYTVFAYDTSENYASGAIVHTRITLISLPRIDEPSLEDILPPDLTYEDFGITLDDFSFFVRGARIEVEDDILALTGGDPLEINLNTDKLPPFLKTIVWTLKQGTKQFSFLMRRNAQEDIYEALVEVPPGPDTYPFIINLINFQNKERQTLFGTMNVSQGILPPPKPAFRIFELNKGVIHYERLVSIFMAILLAYYGYKQYRKYMNNRFYY